MTALYELFFRIGQWFVNLDGRKIVIAILSIIVCLLMYDRHELKADNDRLDSKLTANMRRTDSLISTDREELQECERLRVTELQNTTNFYRDRIDKLEAQMHEDYKVLRQIKRK